MRKDFSAEQLVESVMEVGGAVRAVVEDLPPHIKPEERNLYPEATKWGDWDNLPPPWPGEWDNRTLK